MNNLWPVPCKQGIKIYNQFSLQEMPHCFPLANRIPILKEKKRTLQLLAHHRSIEQLKAKIKNFQVSCDREKPLFARRPTWMAELIDVERILLNQVRMMNLEDIYRRAFQERVLNQRFGTDWINGMWRILTPPDLKNWSDLAGLAHEVGHFLCVKSQQESLLEIAIGEATALKFEELVISQALPKNYLSDWKAYCRAIDEQNLRFFLMEFDPNCIELLQQSKFVYRESLWTSHGYQLVYAVASLIRLENAKAGK